MSKTVAQIYATNPTTVVADTDLYYLVQSPYTPGTDAAITGASLKAVFGIGGTVNPGLVNQLGYYAASGSTISGLATLANGTLVTSPAGVPSISQTLPSPVQANITTLGTITGGTWNATIIGGTYGGTGVNNGANTITLGGNISTAGAHTLSGAFASTFTFTNTTSVTFPTSGTLATTAGTVANATNIGITDDTSTNAIMFPVWVTANTGFLPAKVTSTKMTFNPSTGTLVSSIIGASSISSFVPSTTIESATQAGANTITSSAYVSSATSGARFVGQHARNTYASPAALANNDIIATFGAQGYGATAFSSSAVAYMKMFAAEAFTDTAQGTKITIATTPTGTIVPVDAITISAAGVVAFPVAPLGLTSGGTNASLTASNGGIVYSTASALAILSGTSTAQQLLLSGASTTPQWSTSTYPLTNAINTLLYASAANVMSALATANSSVLVTSAGGVPSLSTTLPSGLTIPGFAASGANADITSLTGLTGVLKAPTAIQSSASVNLLTFTYTALAVNYISLTNAATGNNPLLDATGSDSAVSMNLRTKNGDFLFSDATGTKAPILKFLNAAGTHAVGLRAATALAADPTFVLPSADGSALNLWMKTDGSANLSFGSPPGRYIGTQVLTSGTTYTPTAGTNTIHGRMLGGGGGGGGNGTGAGSGGAGGSTTFASSAYTAPGGNGANANTLPGSPGAAGTIVSSTTDFSSPGSSGYFGGNLSVSGNGGSTFLGGGGAAGGGGADGPAGTTNTGGGGAGAGTNGAFNSGSGGAAGTYTEFWKGSISGTYTYAIGAAGTAGTAGTGGKAGGAGGSGIIIIDEYT